MKRALVLLACAGCTLTSIEKPSSTTDGVPTDAITLSVLSVNGNGVVVDAMLDVVVSSQHATPGKDDVIRLVDGLGGAAVFTGPADALEAKLATSDTGLSIELVRNGAVAKTVPIPLPPAFTVTKPANPSRLAGVAFTWQAVPAFPMDIAATGAPCVPLQGFAAHLEPDTGAFEIQPADLKSTVGTCTITVVFTRGKDRTQTRTVTVSTDP